MLWAKFLYEKGKTSMIGHSEPKLVDSNILVYAYDKSEPKKQCLAAGIIKQRWLEQDGVLSIQNLAEFYHIVAKRISSPIPIDTAKQIVLDLIDGFEIIRYNENTIVNAINNQAIYKIHFWDALIVATMEENGIDTIITENEKHFQQVKWIKATNPFK